MVSQAAMSLRAGLEQKMRELEEAVAGVKEAAAGQRPAEGEWCCKEVLSHLLGDEGEDVEAPFRRFMDEDRPLIGIMTGLPYYTPTRQAMSVGDLQGAVSSRYRGLADFLSSLTDEQLKRKARVPLLKETPIREYPTMAQFVGVLDFHLNDHVNQIRNARQQIGA